MSNAAAINAPTEAVRRFPVRDLALAASVAAGVGLVIAFETGRLLPVRWAVFALFAVFGAALWGVRHSSLSLMVRMGLVLYVTPFLVTLRYLFEDHVHWWPTPLSMDYQDTPRTIEIMLALGLLGLIGLVTGLLLARRVRPPAPRPERLPVLGPLPYFLGLALAFGLSWLAMPTETILEARYGLEQSVTASSTARLDSAFLLSYILLALLLVDGDFDRSPWRRRIKLGALLAVIGYIVVFHQILRGDRESVGLVAALLAYALTTVRAEGAARRKVLRRRLLAAALVAAVMVTVFVGLQVTRMTLGDRALLSPGTLFEGAMEGTWTAVLLTDLSLADRFRRGEMVVENGRTYADYVLSLPPGFLADAVGWRRPLEADRGPTFLFSDVASGGCHLPLVPFMNFGWPGVFAILALFGWMLGRMESWEDRPGRAHRFGYTACFTFLPFWFWYGEMYLIRGVMIMVLFWGAYRLVVGLGLRRVRPAA
jgi:hypothetical protein